MTKLNIGILTEIINGSSGARAPLEIAKYLVNRGHKVTVYAYNYFENKTMREYLTNNGVQVTTLDKSHWSQYFTIPNIFHILKNSQHDVLLFSGTLPFFVAGILSQTPIIRMYMGTQFDAYLERFLPNQSVPFPHLILNRVLNVAIYYMELISFRFAKSVVAISHYAAREGEMLYRKRVVEVIYPGSNAFSGKYRKFSSKQVKLITVSRLTPYKGFHIIINTLNSLSTKIPWRLIIVGSQAKPDYAAYLNKIGKGRIRILIDIDDKSLTRLYSQSDIYVTCDRYLYFGLPVLEAAHLGLPTVTYDSAAAREVVIHNHSGLVVENQQQLSQGLKLLIEQPEFRQKLGAAAKKRAQEFSWELCAKKWEKVLRHFSR